MTNKIYIPSIKLLVEHNSCMTLMDVVWLKDLALHVVYD